MCSIWRWNQERCLFFNDRIWRQRGNFAKSYFFPSSFVSSSRRPVNLRRMKVMIQSISPRNMEAACNRGGSNLPIGKSFPPEGRGGWRKLRFPQCRRPSSRKSACRPTWQRLCSTTLWRPWGPTWWWALCYSPSCQLSVNCRNWGHPEKSLIIRGLWVNQTHL